MAGSSSQQAAIQLDDSRDWKSKRRIVVDNQGVDLPKLGSFNLYKLTPPLKERADLYIWMDQVDKVLRGHKLHNLINNNIPWSMLRDPNGDEWETLSLQEINDRIYYADVHSDARRGGADFGDAGVAWNSYGWAVVQVEPEPDEAGMSMPDSFTFTLSPRMSSIEAMFSHFFQTFQARVHPSEPLRKGHNPRFASRRSVDSRGAFARAAVRARNPVELLARLEYAAGAELTPEPGLDNMFDPQTAEALAGGCCTWAFAAAPYAARPGRSAI
ncbi:hypothetical protein NUH16_005360 [Penicillium rubens]|nr:hypothetical protein NUH16_005360 [Penicillium rubens]